MTSLVTHQQALEKKIMLLLRVAIILSCFLVSMSPSSADIDCMRSKDSFERAICASPRVAALNGELEAAYRAAQSGSANPDAVRAAQHAWVLATRNGCQNEECLARVFRRRIAALYAGEALDDAGVDAENVATAAAVVAAGQVLRIAEQAREAQKQADRATAQARQAEAHLRDLMHGILAAVALFALLILVRLLMGLRSVESEASLQETNEIHDHIPSE